MEQLRAWIISTLLVMSITITLTGCSNTEKVEKASYEPPKQVREDIWQGDEAEVFMCINPDFYVTDRSLRFYTYWGEERYKSGLIQVYALEIDGVEYVYHEENSKFKFQQEQISNKSGIFDPYNKVMLNRDTFKGAEEINLKDAESISLKVGIFDFNLKRKDYVIDFIPNKLTIDKTDNSPVTD